MEGDVNEELMWKVVGGLSGITAGLATRRLLQTGWRRARGGDPPTNPASPSTGWPEALAWAVASGVAMSVARLVSQRGAAGAWKAATGAYPEGLEEVSP